MGVVGWPNTKNEFKSFIFSGRTEILKSVAVRDSVGLDDSRVRLQVREVLLVTVGSLTVSVIVFDTEVKGELGLV